jgi:hypothetical protein
MSERNWRFFDFLQGIIWGLVFGALATAMFFSLTGNLSL